MNGCKIFAQFVIVFTFLAASSIFLHKVFPPLSLPNVSCELLAGHCDVDLLISLKYSFHYSFGSTVDTPSLPYRLAFLLSVFYVMRYYNEVLTILLIYIYTHSACLSLCSSDVWVKLDRNVHPWRFVPIFSVGSYHVVMYSPSMPGVIVSPSHEQFNLSFSLGHGRRAHCAEFGVSGPRTSSLPAAIQVCAQNSTCRLVTRNRRNGDTVYCADWYDNTKEDPDWDTATHPLPKSQFSASIGTEHW